MNAAKNGVRILGALFWGALALWFLLPLFSGMYGIGMVFAVPSLVLCALCASRRFSHFIFGKNKSAARLAAAAMITGFAVTLFALALIVSGLARPADENAGTVVILGSRIYGEEPGPALVARMDRAVEYLAAHPGCDVVVTGGQGRGEDISNAEAMRRYLSARGVDPTRIYIEDRATNTEENLRFSAEIIAQNGLDADIIIVTDGFHQFRARLFAARNGLASSPVSCPFNWLTGPFCWGREVLAVLRAVLLEY